MVLFLLIRLTVLLLIRVKNYEKSSEGEDNMRGLGTNVRFLGLVTVTLLCLMVALSGITSSESRSGSIKIGAILPLTGDSAAWGEQGKYGIELAVEEINAKGGINGKKLEVVYEDSQAIPKNAIISIQKLINIDKVPAVVGDIVSATTLAMAPIARNLKQFSLQYQLLLPQ